MNTAIDYAVFQHVDSEGDLIDQAWFNDFELNFNEDPLASLPVALADVSMDLDGFNSSTPAPVVNLMPPLPVQHLAADNIPLDALPDFARADKIQAANMFPLEFAPPVWKKKYYRTDTKVLQCFPYCHKFPDYREARMLGFDHGSDTEASKRNGVCVPSVDLGLHVSPDISPGNLHIRGRFVQVTPELRSLPEGEALFKVGDVVTSLPERECYKGHLVLVHSGGKQVVNAMGWNAMAVSIHPTEAWTMMLELTRHRRNAAEAPTKVPLFAFEVLVFLQVGSGSYQLCSRAMSTLFEVASSRTLLREVLAYRAMSGGNVAPSRKKSKSASSQQSKSIRLSRVPTQDSQSRVMHPVSMEYRPRSMFWWLPRFSGSGFSHQQQQLQQQQLQLQQQQQQQQQQQMHPHMYPRPALPVNMAMRPAAAPGVMMAHPTQAPGMMPSMMQAHPGRFSQVPPRPPPQQHQQQQM